MDIVNVFHLIWHCNCVNCILDLKDCSEIVINRVTGQIQAGDKIYMCNFTCKCLAWLVGKLKERFEHMENQVV